MVANADAPDTGPPPNIVPANTSLAAVLSGHRRAVGHRTVQTPASAAERWTISFGSLSGTREEHRIGEDVRTDETLGPTSTASGTFKGRDWNQNANGHVTYQTGLHRRDDADQRAIVAASHTGVTLLGRVKAPVDAYVVKIDPPGGRLEYVFFDAATLLIDRIESIRDGRRMTVTYSDYRATAGVQLPWQIRSSDGFSTNDAFETLVSYTVGEPIAPSAVAIPTPGPPLLRAPAGGVTVPVTIADDRIVVRTRMGGHAVDFLMDSGADGIVIDEDIVEALHLRTYGRMKGETAGSYALSDTVLPQVDIGPLTMRNVHAIGLPFVQHSADGTPIAGLLGYDFIADLVWRIDYSNGTLQAFDPASFVPPSGARAFALTFDDRVPTISARIAGVAAPAMLVDTGADRSTLFSSFVDAHAAAMSDRGLGSEMQAAWPFLGHFSGVGGTVAYRPLQAGPFQFGSFAFPKWLFYVTQNAASFEFEDYDGLIGQDVLRNFDVYLDYPHAKMYLVPNNRFRQRWPDQAAFGSASSTISAE